MQYVVVNKQHVHLCGCMLVDRFLISWFRCTENPFFFVFSKKNLVKELRIALTTTLLLTFLSSPILAKHIIGGEIYYECLGPVDGDPTVKRYQVYMKIYRDCLGSGDVFDSSPGSTTTASVSIFRGSEFVRTQYLEAPVVNSVDPNPGNECVLVPPDVCVEEGLYTFIEIELPVSEDPYHIVYQRCCRNEALTNINDPGISGATYTIDITPEAQQASNNSPVFNEFPPFIICAGEEFAFDHSATDPDGHRLEYRFCSPYLGGGANNQTPDAEDGIAPDPDNPPPFEEVSFVQPTYSADNPLGQNSNFQIDPNSGLITGVPMQSGQFVVTVCVAEYDANDVLLSEVRRDFQFLVTDCERPITIDISSDEVAPDGTFVLNSCSAGNITIDNQSQGQENVESFRWEFDVAGNTQVYEEWSPVVSFPDAGTYTGQLLVSTNTGCMDSAQVSVNVLSGLAADFTFDDPGCDEGAISFANQSQVGTNPSYTWDFGDGSTSSEPDPVYTYATPGTRQVSLVISDDNGCVDSTTQTIDYYPLPATTTITVSSMDVCLPEETTFSTDLPALSSDYTVAWDFGDGTTSADQSPVYTYAPGTYMPSLQVSAPNGCQVSATLANPITVREAPSAGFTFSPDPPTTLNSTVDFTNTSEGGDSYTWDFGGLGTSMEEAPSFTFPDSGSFRIVLTVGSSNGCTDSVSQVLSILPVVAYYVPNAFSPNNDGRNDVFRGFGPGGGLQEFEFAVFTRWGDRIFYTRDPNQGWDGTHLSTGDPLPQGAYVYYMTFLGPEGDRIQKKGLVNLIR